MHSPFVQIVLTLFLVIVVFTILLPTCRKKLHTVQQGYAGSPTCTNKPSLHKPHITATVHSLCKAPTTQVPVPCSSQTQTAISKIMCSNQHIKHPLDRHQAVSLGKVTVHTSSLSTQALLAMQNHQMTEITLKLTYLGLPISKQQQALQLPYKLA